MYFLNTEGQLQNIDNENIDSTINSVNPRLFLGRQLISISEKNWHDKVVLKDAKRLLRISLKPLLGDKPLQSRKLFRSKTS